MNLQSHGAAAPEARPLTRAVDFHWARAEDEFLFRVNPGLPATQAISMAQCLLSHLRSRLGEAVGGESIQADEAFALELLLDMAAALYQSAGVVE